VVVVDPLVGSTLLALVMTAKNRKNLGRKKDLSFGINFLRSNRSGENKDSNPNEELMQESYSIAKRQGNTLRDAVFVSIAAKLGLQ
jgi:hypothetical protein